MGNKSNRFFELDTCFHNENYNDTILYHGSPTKIKDHSIAAGTYFSINKDIAKEYGNFIYSIELDRQLALLFKPDLFQEHLISSCAIPMYLFNKHNV